MSKLKRYGKIILFDMLAVICFIGVILFGWLPGPGGIPLFLLGLGLLAVNHEWAKRWLETAKHKGVTFKQWLFPNVQWIRYSYDVAGVAFMIMGGLLIYRQDNRLVAGVAVVLICSGLFLFLLNRDRFDKLSRFVRKKH